MLRHFQNPDIKKEALEGRASVNIWLLKIYLAAKDIFNC